MTIDYNLLTFEQLEEHVEFIDWSIIPSSFLTKELINSFGFIPQLNVRLWFEDLLTKMEIKEDQENYPGWVFFFIEDKCYMELNTKKGYLWCSSKRIWSVFEKKYLFNCDEIQLVIKNIVEIYFKNMEVTPQTVRVNNFTKVEMHFKHMKVIPTSILGTYCIGMETHFKNKK